MSDGRGWSRALRPSWRRYLEPWLTAAVSTLANGASVSGSFCTVNGLKEECAMDLTGKAALVTGGSGDLGGAIAPALAKAGVDVAVTYASHPEEAKATATAVQAAGRRSLVVPLDQRDQVAIDTAVEAVGPEVWPTGYPCQ